MKKIFTKKEKPNQGDNTKKKEEKDIVQSIGSYHDFLIMEKKDKINNQVLEFKNVESENNFLNDFLILQHRPKQEKSRFIDFFKEMEEKEKEKEKTEKIDEAEEYFANNEARKCKATEYAVKNGAYVDDNGYTCWWLRSMFDGFYQVYYVLSDGNFSHSSADYAGGVVRPVLWINL